MRRRRSSETFGRPSGERSPFQGEVIASRSAFEAAIPLGRSWAIAAVAPQSQPSRTAIGSPFFSYSRRSSSDTPVPEIAPYVLMNGPPRLDIP